MLPGGWPHCVVTPEDSVVLGGNFLTGYNLPIQLDIWRMEERLKVRSKFRFPLFKQLMWHTTSYYLARLRSTTDVVSRYEKEGLVRLCAYLQSWLQQSKDGSDLPYTIKNPSNLVHELENTLKREGFVRPTVDSRAPATLRVMFRPLSPERPVPQWPNLVEGEDTEEEIAPEDTDDGEFDPSDEDDMDFQVAVTSSPWSKRQRTPSTKKLERKPSGPKRSVVFALPRIPTPSTTTPTKTNSSVRARLLKKCGLDPRIPLPSPKARPKEDC